MKIQPLALVVAGSLATPFVSGISQTLVDSYSFQQKAPVNNEFSGKSIWLFGSSGVYAFTPDGSEQLMHIPNQQVCGDPATFDGPSYRYCRFNDMVSDGKRFVFAGRGSTGQITLFDIDTGSVVGSYKSCLNPSDLDYHALRDEVWVRCTDYDANSTTAKQSHLDVISASNPSGDIMADIMLKDRAIEEDLSSSGYTVVHHSLGDKGYLTDDSNSKLFKVDLSTRDIVDSIDTSLFSWLSPPVHGLYNAAYSPSNGHIFVRALMCCTCGSAEDDKESCGRSPGYPVSPTTGKGAGKEGVTGLCGRSCSGIEGVDTVGVYEIDTSTDTVVSTHLLGEGIGGEPYPSLNGSYIVIMGKNGGSTIRILQVGAPGLPSTILADLELDFKIDGDRNYEGHSVARDFAFALKDDKTYLIIPSGTAHEIAIVDFSDNFSVKKVMLTDKFFENTAPHGRYRSVEWAVGTDYVWTNDSKEDEHYVIDFIQGKLVNTVTGIDRSELLSVTNWDRVREYAEKEAMMTDIQVMQYQAMQETSQTTLKTVEDLELVRATSQRNSIMQEVAAMQQGQEVLSSNSSTATANEESGSSLAVAALVIGIFALVVGIANLYALNKIKHKNGSSDSVGTTKVIATGVPAAVSSGNVHVGDAASVQDSVTSSLQAQNIM